MKKILLLTMMAILATTASAYDFMVDGICIQHHKQHLGDGI